MIQKKDLLVLSALRQNARESLTKISRKTSVPVSTIFDKLKQFDKNLIVQHSTLINFAELGFNTRAKVMIKVAKEQRDSISDYLSKHHHINSLSKINNGFDFMFEVIFRNIKDMEDFMENLESKFNILDKNVYYIIDDIKKEHFLSEPELVELVM